MRRLGIDLRLSCRPARFAAVRRMAGRSCAPILKDPLVWRYVAIGARSWRSSAGAARLSGPRGWLMEPGAAVWHFHPLAVRRRGCASWPAALTRRAPGGGAGTPRGANPWPAGLQRIESGHVPAQPANASDLPAPLHPRMCDHGPRRCMSVDTARQARRLGLWFVG
jgi:hypothetical protein